ncbi:MAG: phosphoadenosine phosphosulfate reductase family protein [Crenarchaeota archaeon]|nr:phosphoadenosine phosphosulfate reductase family protein [Thermoproteota archaeon]
MDRAEGIITILVRAKKDRDVVRHVVEHYYKDWENMIDIETLEGARDADKIIEKIRTLKNRYIIVLLGREECKGAEEASYDRPNVSIVRLRTSKVRNMRPLELFVNIEKGKADMRLRVFWIGSHKLYVLGYSRYSRRSRRIVTRLHPLYDIYLCLERCVDEILRIPKLDLDTNCLLVLKRVHDEHDIYVCGRRALELIIPENDAPYARSIRNLVDKCIVDIGESIKISYSFLMIHENICKTILRRAYEEEDYDKVIVPWSGGKDSTACLILALKTFGKDVVCPIYVDTGLDYNLNRLYINYVSNLLKVDTIIEKIDISDYIDVRGLPTHDSRWCTRLKLKALKRAIDRVSSRPLIVVGDRDTESIYRLKRPFIRRFENVIQVAPLKLWSSIMVQYYLLLNKIPLNPLYMLGFYRLGCFICPAYRYYELDLAEKVLRIDDESTFLDLLREQSCLIY